MPTDVCLSLTSSAQPARHHPSLPASVCTASQCQLAAQLTAALNSLAQNEYWVGGVLTDIVQAIGTSCHERLASVCHQPQFYQHLFNILTSLALNSDPLISRSARCVFSAWFTYLTLLSSNTDQSSILVADVFRNELSANQEDGHHFNRWLHLCFQSLVDLKNSFISPGNNLNPFTNQVVYCHLDSRVSASSVSDESNKRRAVFAASSIIKHIEAQMSSFDFCMRFQSENETHQFVFMLSRILTLLHDWPQVECRDFQFSVIETFSLLLNRNAVSLVSPCVTSLLQALLPVYRQHDFDSRLIVLLKPLSSTAYLQLLSCDGAEPVSKRHKSNQPTDSEFNQSNAELDTLPTPPLPVRLEASAWRLSAINLLYLCTCARSALAGDEHNRAVFVLYYLISLMARDDGTEYPLNFTEQDDEMVMFLDAASEFTESVCQFPHSEYIESLCNDLVNPIKLFGKMLLSRDFETIASDDIDPHDSVSLLIDLLMSNETPFLAVFNRFLDYLSCTENSEIFKLPIYFRLVLCSFLPLSLVDLHHRLPFDVSPLLTRLGMLRARVLELESSE